MTSKTPFTRNAKTTSVANPGTMSLETLKSNVLATIYNVFIQTKAPDLLRLRSTLDIADDKDWTIFQENCNGHLMSMLTQPENKINIQTLSNFTNLTKNIQELWDRRFYDPSPEPVSAKSPAHDEKETTIPCLEESSEEASLNYRDTILNTLKKASQNYLTPTEKDALAPVISRIEALDNNLWIFIFHAENNTLDETFTRNVPVTQQRIEELQTIFTDAKANGFNSASGTLQNLILTGAANLAADKEQSIALAKQQTSKRSLSQ
ncbi:MAG: hypothetical protein ACPG05_00280 [Bdellovibrionales bacterium]